MKDHDKTDADLSWASRAEMALKEAVAQAIQEHARDGDPIVIWRDGKVVLEHPKPAAVAEEAADYQRATGSSRSPSREQKS